MKRGGGVSAISIATEPNPMQDPSDLPKTVPQLTARARGGTRVKKRKRPSATGAFSMVMQRVERLIRSIRVAGPSVTGPIPDPPLEVEHHLGLMPAIWVIFPDPNRLRMKNQDSSSV